MKEINKKIEQEYQLQDFFTILYMRVYTNTDVRGIEICGRIGCSPKTFSGLTGRGDLIVTCTSEHSGNNQCGQLISQGVSTEQAIKQVGMVVEGINALPAAVKLAEQYKGDMPIITAVDVNGGKKPRDKLTH